MQQRDPGRRSQPEHACLTSFALGSRPSTAARTHPPPLQVGSGPGRSPPSWSRALLRAPSTRGHLSSLRCMRVVFRLRSTRRRSLGTSAPRPTVPLCRIRHAGAASLRNRWEAKQQRRRERRRMMWAPAGWHGSRRSSGAGRESGRRRAECGSARGTAGKSSAERLEVLGPGNWQIAGALVEPCGATLRRAPARSLAGMTRATG